MNINNLERQHTEIKDIFSKIERLLYKNNFNENIDELVLNINTLAGKLKIHMNTEDRLLYPQLINSDVENLKNIANEYSKEMGDIHNIFINFKNKFNTKNKILSDLDGFLEEIKRVFPMLKNRIEKEDKHLYPKIKNL